jgi:hypothetical protein
MSNSLLGSVVIRHPDLPQAGLEPGGGTISHPRHPSPGQGTSAMIRDPTRHNARGISVRLEATDALETHFGEAIRTRSGRTAREELLLLAGASLTR